jgi:hypothetical protein
MRKKKAGVVAASSALPSCLYLGNIQALQVGVFFRLTMTPAVRAGLEAR